VANADDDDNACYECGARHASDEHALLFDDPRAHSNSNFCKNICLSCLSDLYEEEVDKAERGLASLVLQVIERYRTAAQRVTAGCARISALAKELESVKSELEQLKAVHEKKKRGKKRNKKK